MKAVVWKDVDKIDIEEVPEPESKDEVIVRTGFTGICGSDITIKTGHHPRAKTPLVLGHEFMGVISFVPPHLRDQFSVGQRVSVNPLISCKKCRPCLAGNEHVCTNLKLIGVERNPGAFTEYVSIPQPERIHPLPENVSDEEGAMIEPLAVAVHAAETAALRSGETAVVLGAGPIGLLVAQVARHHGAAKVVVAETEPARLKLAQKLGFQTIDVKQKDIVKEVDSITGGYGADVTFDAAGVPVTASQVIPITGVKGRIVMVAIHKKPAEVLFRDLAYREIAILGVRIYSIGSFPKAIELVAKGQVDLKPLITDVFPMEEALKAFDLAQNSKEACKILVKQ